jgi:hypothetical protein
MSAHVLVAIQGKTAKRVSTWIPNTKVFVPIYHVTQFHLSAKCVQILGHANYHYTRLVTNEFS